ncbi:MAG: hypothetical protein Q7V62_14390, partial [Actinomycetota bacterium]|nr:hypothetical protein [Actinomycetota bacterium]
MIASARAHRSRTCAAGAVAFALIGAACGEQRADSATTAASFTSAQATLVVVVSGVDRPVEI